MRTAHQFYLDIAQLPAPARCLIAWLAACELCACSDDAGTNGGAGGRVAVGGTSGASGSGGSGEPVFNEAGGSGGASGSGAGGASVGGNFGDIGSDCEPSAEPSGCALECIALADGSGVCTNLCGTSGELECPSGYKCNTVPFEGTSYDICLPNASCGALDYQGECSGSVLRFCGVEGPVSADCSQLVGGNGSPMQCALVASDIGFDCVSSQFTPGCGQESANGRCAGDVLTFCTSAESGEVTTTDCSLSSQSCVVAADGIAGCAAPGTEGCGAVTYQGGCTGSVLQYCSDSQVVVADCASGALECGYVDEVTGFNCMAPTTVSSGSQRVRGSISFEKPALTPDGLGAVANAPVRQAFVRLLRAVDGQELARSLTGDDGSFDFSFDEDQDVVVQVAAVGDQDVNPFTVQSCPLDDCSGLIYTAVSAGFTPSLDTDLGALLITVAGGKAGAFNIFDQFVRGAAFALQNFGRIVPTHVVRWQSESTTMCSTSCFSSRTNTIYINGSIEDTDEFDDPVLMHEYGHFLESAFSKASNPGGGHDGSPADPRLAWGEGYGTYVGATIAGSSLYIDTFASGASVIDINATGSPHARADDTAIAGMNQLISEYLTAEVLWHISNGSPAEAGGRGTGPVFDVLGNYFPSPALLDRGVQGVDLVDFLDGWFCRGHEDSAFIYDIVSFGHGFPYDYASLPSCL